MALYMDRHEGLRGITPQDAAEAHIKDLEVQGRYGVRYQSYWLDQEKGVVFCLVEAPNVEVAEAVHRESHGMVAAKIIEVDRRMVEAFLGTLHEPAAGEPWVATAFRVILFTDIEGSTRLTQELGDAAAMELLRDHDRIVRQQLGEWGGDEVKHTGDGIMASFTSVVRAVRCARGIQEQLATRNRDTRPPLSVRIGINAGEPVAESDDLFGATVQLAARLCERAEPGSVLVSGPVRELTRGSGFRFQRLEPMSFKGFDEPIHPYVLDWQD